MASKYRKLAIVSFLVAWHGACNYKNCQAAAIATGTYPCNEEIPLSSHFVKELNPIYQERARAHQQYVDSSLNINGKVITDDDVLDEINQYLIDNEAPEYCLKKEIESYAEAIESIAAIEENGAKLLSAFPKYVDDDGQVQKMFF